MTAKKRILKNLMSNSFGQAVTLLIQLAAIPIFIKHAGVDLYAHWIVLSTFPGYLNLVESGLTPVVSNLIYLKKDENNVDEIKNSYLILLTFVLAIGWIAAVGCWYYFDEITGERYTYSRLQSFVLVSCFYLGGMINVAVNVKSIYFRLNYISYVHVAINNFSRVIENSVILLYVIFADNVSIVLLSIVYLLGRGLNLTLVTMLSHGDDVFKGKLNLIKLNLGLIKAIIMPSGAYCLFAYINVLLSQSVVIVLNQLVGPAYLVVINSYRTISRLMLQISTVINHSLIPEVTTLYKNSDLYGVKKLLLRSLGAIACICLISSGGLFMLQSYIINWLHIPIADGQSNLYALILIETALFTMWNAFIMPLVAINLHSTVAIACSAIYSLALLVSYSFDSTVNYFFVTLIFAHVTAIIVTKIKVYGVLRRRLY